MKLYRCIQWVPDGIVITVNIGIRRQATHIFSVILLALIPDKLPLLHVLPAGVEFVHF